MSPFFKLFFEQRSPEFLHRAGLPSLCWKPLMASYMEGIHQLVLDTFLDMFRECPVLFVKM